MCRVSRGGATTSPLKIAFARIPTSAIGEYRFIVRQICFQRRIVTIGLTGCLSAHTMTQGIPLDRNGVQGLIAISLSFPCVIIATWPSRVNNYGYWRIIIRVLI